MKFSDNIKRDNLDTVLVVRTHEEMSSREEANSNLVEFIRVFNSKRRENIYSIPVRDIKIGENIVTKCGKFITYRVN